MLSFKYLRKVLMCIMTTYFSSQHFNNNKHMSSSTLHIPSYSCSVDANVETSLRRCSTSASVVYSAGWHLIGSSSWGLLWLALSLEANTFFNRNWTIDVEYSALGRLFDFLFVLGRAWTAFSIAVLRWTLVWNLDNSLSSWN